MKTKLLISGLAFMALTTLAGAQNTKVPSLKSQKEKYTVNVDANKSKGTEANTSYGMVGMQKQGCGQGMGQGCAQGMCKGMCKEVGKGMGQGMCNNMGQGKGSGKNFIDTDKNGICDFLEVSSKK